MLSETNNVQVQINGDVIIDGSLSATNLIVNTEFKNFYTDYSAIDNSVVTWSGTFNKWVLSPNASTEGVYINNSTVDMHNNLIEDSANTLKSKVTFTPKNLTYIPLKIDTGWFTTFVISENNELYSYGAKNNLSLGYVNESMDHPVEIPTVVDVLWKTVKTGGQFSGKYCFTIGLDLSGYMYSWGSDHYSTLNINHAPLGAVRARSVPARVIGPTRNTLWSTVDCGDSHVAAIDSNMKLYLWGDNTSAQLLDLPSTVPTATVVYSNKTWKYVSCGKNHTIAIDTDNIVHSFGDNTYGQLGNGTNNNLNTATRLSNSFALTVWKDIKCGADFTVGLDDSGKIFCWGDNTSFQLGLSSMRPQFTSPQPIHPSVSDKTWIKISCGNAHAAAIDDSGSLYMWGNNYDGQCGSGVKGGFIKIPTRIDTGIEIKRWKDVSCGYAHTIAVDIEDNIFMFGNDVNDSVVSRTKFKPIVNTAVDLTRSFNNVNCKSVYRVRTGEYVLTLQTPVKDSYNKIIFDNKFDTVKYLSHVINDTQIMLRFMKLDHTTGTYIYFDPQKATILTYGI